MFGYYCNLALRSFRRNKVLTALMVLAIALGIGASMTTLTVFHILAGDPIPQKSDKLFYPRIEPRSKRGYIPGEDGRITGLSKLARLVDVFSRRPQVQERLTTQIADSLLDILGAQGVIVVIEAEHLCMTMRGVRKPGAKTITSAIRGSMHNPATRAEAMSLIMHGTR